MLAAAEEWLVDHGGRRIRMTVIDRREPLIAWYERRGYRRTGETEPFPYHEQRLGTPRYDDLAFVVLEKQLGGSAGPRAGAGA